MTAAVSWQQNHALLGKGGALVTEGTAEVLGRFTAACREDPRVVAAFIGGSHAAGTADEYSDLDLYLIVGDEDYDAIFAERRAFLGRLSEPVFCEDFSDFGFDMVVFIFSDGVEGELTLGRVSGFDHIHGGPYEVLVDEEGIVEGRVFPLLQPTQAEQRRTLRWLLYWFWRDLAVFTRTIARGRLWTAYGLLEGLRLKCVNVARIKHEFFSVGMVGYKDLEQAADARDLEALRRTMCPLEREAMLEAAGRLVGFYLRTAPPLAAEHEIAYPADLEAVVMDKLQRWCGLHLDTGSTEGQ
jgi:predicted nucleotidyltransferase